MDRPDECNTIKAIDGLITMVAGIDAVRMSAAAQAVVEVGPFSRLGSDQSWESSVLPADLGGQ